MSYFDNTMLAPALIAFQLSFQSHILSPILSLMMSTNSKQKTRYTMYVTRVFGDFGDILTKDGLPQWCHSNWNETKIVPPSEVSDCLATFEFTERVQLLLVQLALVLRITQFPPCLPTKIINAATIPREEYQALMGKSFEEVTTPSPKGIHHHLLVNVQDRWIHLGLGRDESLTPPKDGNPMIHLVMGCNPPDRTIFTYRIW